MTVELNDGKGMKLGVERDDTTNVIFFDTTKIPSRKTRVWLTSTCYLYWAAGLLMQQF